MAISSLLLETITTVVGIDHHIYSYLHPTDDLLSLRSSCHQLHQQIQTQFLIKICIQHHLINPIKLGVTTNYLVEMKVGRTYHSKEEFVNDVLDRLHTSHLQIVGTNSIQDSMEKAREMLIDQDRSSAMFYDATTSNAADDVVADIINNNPRIAASNPKWITVECHYQTNVTKESATAWIDYILNRDACKRSIVDRCNNKFVRDWLRCILSLQQQRSQEQEEQEQQEQQEEEQQQEIIGSNTNNNNIQIQIWRWGCKHSLLKGKGVSGVGVMISSGGCEALELCLTRLY
jgi:hypothetical protein